jgi:hypothetical protein
MSPALLKPFCNSINPLIALILALVLLKMHLGKNPGTLPFFFRSVAALLATYLLAHLNRRYHLWPAHLLFPSGHMAFFVSASVSLFLLDRRWLLLSLPLGILFGWMMVALHFHPWFDLWGAIILAVPVTLLCHINPAGNHSTGSQG